MLYRFAHVSVNQQHCLISSEIAVARLATVTDFPSFGLALVTATILFSLVDTKKFKEERSALYVSRMLNGKSEL